MTAVSLVLLQWKQHNPVATLPFCNVAHMVSHTSSAVALALRASTPVQSGKTRICISGFAKYSHNTGHSKKLANAIVKAYPQDHETWYHMASTELEVSTERSSTPQHT